MILVTGCFGYIGRLLCERLLNEGCSVRGLAFSDEVKTGVHSFDPRLDVWVGDITKKNTLTGIGKSVDVVYHLVGMHGLIEKMRELYVNGTKNLLRELSNSSIKRFIFVSNHAVYGECGDELITESRIVKSEHPFGKISIEAEKYVQFAIGQGVPAIILRVSEVYGPGKYNVFTMINKTGVSLLGDGNNFMSRIHIEDLLNLLVLAKSGLDVGNIYNLSDKLSIRQKEYYQEIEKKSGVKVRWIPAEEVSDRVKLGIHGLRMLSLRLCSDKVTEKLGYCFLYPDAHLGIDSMFNSYLRGE